MSQAIIRSFDELSEAQNQLTSNKLTYPAYHHYIQSIDAAVCIVREAGTNEKLYSGFIDNEKDVHIVIATPVPLETG